MTENTEKKEKPIDPDRNYVKPPSVEIFNTGPKDFFIGQTQGAGGQFATVLYPLRITYSEEFEGELKFETLTPFSQPRVILVCRTTVNYSYIADEDLAQNYRSAVEELLGKLKATDFEETTTEQ